MVGAMDGAQELVINCPQTPHLTPIHFLWQPHIEVYTAYGHRQETVHQQEPHLVQSSKLLSATASPGHSASTLQRHIISPFGQQILCVLAYTMRIVLLLFFHLHTTAWSPRKL